MLVAEAAPLETSFDRPGLWIGGMRADGSRWASYADPMPNAYAAGLLDGLYVEVSEYLPALPLVWACATRTDRDRAQLVHVQRYADWDDALRAADAWRDEAEAFLCDPFILLHAQAAKDEEHALKPRGGA